MDGFFLFDGLAHLVFPQVARLLDGVILLLREPVVNWDRLVRDRPRDEEGFSIKAGKFVDSAALAWYVLHDISSGWSGETHNIAGSETSASSALLLVAVSWLRAVSSSIPGALLTYQTVGVSFRC